MQNSTLYNELSKQEIMISVVKRNGILVPFRRERIFRALEAAFCDTKKIAILTDDLRQIVTELSNIVSQQALEQASQDLSVTVEGIQDLVEVLLMQEGHHEVARDYIVYRNQRKAKREALTPATTIYRRDRTTGVRFNPIKISASLERAFRRTQNLEEPLLPLELIELINQLTQRTVAYLLEVASKGQTLYVEMVEEQLGRELMKEGLYDVAKYYILYCGEKSKKLAPTLVEDKKEARQFWVTAPNSEKLAISEQVLRAKIGYACRGLADQISIEMLLEATVVQFYEGMQKKEVDLATILAARAQIEIDPVYAQVASRLLLDLIYRETLNVSAPDLELAQVHRQYFKKYVREGIALERLSPALMSFDLEMLAQAMDLQRDDLFAYLGLQTLYDRYFIHHEQRRLETPQIFWMRVAMGLALNEGDHKNQRAIEFYDLLSQFYFTSSTPTLFNSGTPHSQLSSCYLSTVEDDLAHIFKVVSDNAQLSKWAGGLGNDWTNVRATGAHIHGTNGASQGVIPFLKVANDTAVAVNQGGKRKGALCVYLETWHLDIEDFLELRKNTGDERRRTHDMNTANWIPDLFMKRVKENGHWTLFNPSDVPDLHDLYGTAFEKRYMHYEAMVDAGQIKLFKRMEAQHLWRKMLSMLFETGHPWITFKDPSNIRSPQAHQGVVHSSNLCTEILLNTSAKETAVCNLGSINLVRHVTNAGLDEERLAATVRTAIRMLDNVVDVNFYPTMEARNSNLAHRPIGLGIMGFQDALYIQSMSYASHAAVAFADRSMEMISYYALLASAELAREKGSYPSYAGSKWSQGLLPIDTIELLEKERGHAIPLDRSCSMDWSLVRAAIRQWGMRNSNTMAIAPTATIGNITGVTPSIEPTYKHLFVKSNLSGEFTIPNPYLVAQLKSLGLWDAEMLDDLKYFDGSLREIERIPNEIKQLFPSAFEVEPEWVIECAARRQKWIDMGQSLNLYLSEPNGKKLHQMYMLAWEKGLKTTYYLRSLGATQIEKSTMDINKRGLQPRWMKNRSASSNIQVDREEGPPKACNLGEECESCQ